MVRKIGGARSTLKYRCGGRGPKRRILKSSGKGPHVRRRKSCKDGDGLRPNAGKKG